MALHINDLRFDLLVASIDLAETMVANHEYTDATHLVAEVYPIMASWKLHRHALAAWLVFQEGIEKHKVESLFDELRLYYRRHWSNPREFMPKK